MLSKTEKKFSIIYVILLTIELFTDSNSDFTNVHYFAKPAILIALILFFWIHSKQLEANSRILTILALLFSLIGDVLLMFVDTSLDYFIGGLVSFLIAHLMYVVVFLKKRNSNKSAAPILIILLIYASGIFYFLKTGLGDMLIPVTLYMIVILTMSTTAFLRKQRVNSSSYNFVLFGAILFMISDSLLALNKFYEPLAYVELSIMTTYAFAQLFIVFGINKQS